MLATVEILASATFLNSGRYERSRSGGFVHIANLINEYIDIRRVPQERSLALVQIFEAGMATPLDWPGVHTASTAFQIAGAVLSLICKRRSANWFLPMRRSSSMPAIVVAAQS